ncbi:MAG: NUDIX hydrolase [Bacteroidota bacterium]
MPIPPWKKLAEKTVYNGYRNMVRKTFELPDGRVEDFDIIDNQHFVSVAAFTPDKEVILVNQYRPGPEQPLWSVAEGYIDPGEAPIVSAARELREETGYEAGELVFLREIRRTYEHERKIIFVATNCMKVGDLQLDENEFLEMQLMPLEEFRAFLKGPASANFESFDVVYLALDYLGWL